MTFLVSERIGDNVSDGASSFGKQALGTSRWFGLLCSGLRQHPRQADPARPMLDGRWLRRERTHLCRNESLGNCAIRPIKERNTPLGRCVLSAECSVANSTRCVRPERAPNIVLSRACRWDRVGA
jgi:hypothetical protein